jgi:hypothetical protein
MSRPPLEVADLIRAAGAGFVQRSRQWIGWKHVKVLQAIARCRTAALGGHLDRCTRCGHRATISYNSCRNRHCPKCQTAARERWIAARRQQLLPTRYVHAVFTLPAELAPLALQNKKVVYDLLFRASAQTLLKVARDPKHLGAEIGFFSVLHTWNQKLGLHPHVHCVIASGGLSPDGTRWIKPRHAFFLPVKVLACFAASSSLVSNEPSRMVNSTSTEIWHRSPRRRPSPPGSDYCSERTGWFIANDRSEAPSTCSSIWAAILTAWRSPTIAWSRWQTARSRSVGAIPLTTTNRSC